MFSIFLLKIFALGLSDCVDETNCLVHETKHRQGFLWCGLLMAWVAICN